LVGNKERESYGQSMIRTESNTIGRGGGMSQLLNPFNKK
jgi:hypothetical protein